jgi:hypothetical protein
MPSRRAVLTRPTVTTRLLYIPLRYRHRFSVGGCRCRQVPTGTKRCRQVPTGAVGAGGRAARYPPCRAALSVPNLQFRDIPKIRGVRSLSSCPKKEARSCFGLFTAFSTLSPTSTCEIWRLKRKRRLHPKRRKQNLQPKGLAHLQAVHLQKEKLRTLIPTDISSVQSSSYHSIVY